MLSSFPGFSSYSATVDDHSKATQKAYTRVVGPSAANLDSFKER